MCHKASIVTLPFSKYLHGIETYGELGSQLKYAAKNEMVHIL